jgi:hypothetical protein
MPVSGSASPKPVVRMPGEGAADILITMWLSVSARKALPLSSRAMPLARPRGEFSAGRLDAGNFQSAPATVVITWADRQLAHRNILFQIPSLHSHGGVHFSLYPVCLTQRGVIAEPWIAANMQIWQKHLFEPTRFSEQCIGDSDPRIIARFAATRAAVGSSPRHRCPAPSTPPRNSRLQPARAIVPRTAAG